MYQIIIVIHGLIGFCIIGLVLIQQGKGADAGAAFGSGASGSVFGAQGSASFLSRSTAILAACFFTTSLGLAVLSGHQGKKADLIDSISVDETKSDVPLTPAKAVENEAPVETPTEVIPVAPAIKEVGQAPAESPKAE
ncbi:MAG: preprotein translocase subunit SecG [Methylococcales bacterium]|nr:preprotein translocase subunit SecG [Methylococcales bacterium]